MSAVRARSTTSTRVTNADDNSSDTPPERRSAGPSLPQRAISQTLTSTAQLANLLPTGTLLTLQLLTPTFTNNGSCDAVTRPMTTTLLVFMAVFCFLSSLTDSFKCSDGRVFYGFATFKGMWLFDYPTASGAGLPDLTKYKLSFIDWIHGVLSAFVLLALALRDKNVLNCFYPTPTHEIQEILNVAPLGIGLVSSTLFVVFPTRRHGVGYPVTPGN